QADLRQAPGPRQARRGQGNRPSLETATVTGRRIVSPPASERGGHARPRGLFTPRPRRPGSDPATDAPAPDGDAPWPDSEVFAPDANPLPPGTHPLESDAPPLDPDGHGPGPAVPNGAIPRSRGTRAFRAAPGGSRPARHVAPSSGRPGRKAAPAARRAKRSRIAAAAIVVVGVLVIGLATGFGSELSAEPTAQSFLLAWQQQQYAAAGALTTAPAGTVAVGLRSAVAQLGAPQLLLSMKSVVQHGGTAKASFTATVDLAQQGRVWTYQGHFGLRRVGDNWK